MSPNPDGFDLGRQLEEIAWKVDPATISLKEATAFLMLVVELSGNLSQQVSILRERVDRLEQK